MPARPTGQSSHGLESKNHHDKSKEADQLNSSDIGENHLTSQGSGGLDVLRQESDKSYRPGEGQASTEFDALRADALRADALRANARLKEGMEKYDLQNLEKSSSEGVSEKNSSEGVSEKNSSEGVSEKNSSEGVSEKNSSEGVSEKNSSEESKTGEKEHSRLSRLKDAIAYTIISLTETVGMGVSAIVRDAVQSFGGETGGAGANGFSPADMLLLNRGMDPEHLTKGMDPEQQTSGMEQEIQERQASQGQQEKQELGNNNM